MTIILPKQCVLKYFLPWKFFMINFLFIECFTLCSASMRTAQPETDRFFCRKLCKVSFHKRKVAFSKGKVSFQRKKHSKTFNRRPVQICWTIGRRTSYICLLLQTNFFLCSEWRRRKLLFKVSFLLLRKKEGKKQQDMFSVHLSRIRTSGR